MVDKSGLEIDISLDIIKKNNETDILLGGGVKDINDDWLQITIELIDNAKLYFVCRDIELIWKGVKHEK